MGKLKANIDLLIAEITASGFKALPIHMTHAAMMHQLPDIHRDPFDRILIAQAQCEPLQLVTSDRSLAEYSELVITV